MLPQKYITVNGNRAIDECFVITPDMKVGVVYIVFGDDMRPSVFVWDEYTVYRLEEGW